MKKSSFLVICLIVIAVATIFYVRGNYAERDKSVALEKVRVQAGWLLNGEFANICAAIVNGDYEEEGLDVEMIPGGPSGASFVIATNAVAIDDSLTIGVDGDIIPLLRGKDREDDGERMRVKVFASFWNQNPYGFMVREDSGISSIKDFAKRKPDGSKYKIGVTADSVIQYAIADYLDIELKDLELVTVGFDAAPFLTKQVDALAGYWTTQAYELEKAGIAYRFLPTSEMPGFDQPSMLAVATEKTLLEKKDTLIRWLRATNKGFEYLSAYPDKAADYILDQRCGGPSFDKEQEAWLIKKSIPLFDVEKPGWVRESQIQDFVSAYKALGQIKRVPSIDELVDYSVLESVYK